MKRLALACAALAATLLASMPARAQNASTSDVLGGGCGSITYDSGRAAHDTQNTSGQKCVDATVSVSASVTGFTAASVGTPIAVTTGGVTGTLPAGTVVVATNVGTTNGAYCALGASSTTSWQYIAPNGGWFAFTVGASTQLSCITSTSTTTVNMVGGAGLPTGTGGGGGGGGGGSVTQGTSPWVVGVTQWATGVLGAMANYGTSPGAVLVPGVNAFVTNTIAATVSGVSTAANQATEITSLGTIVTNTGTTGTNTGTIVTNTGTTNTDIGPPGATACATDTGSCSVNALLQRVAQRLTTLIAGGTSSITTWGGGTLGAMANYGTDPGAVLVPGVNNYQTGGANFAVSGAAVPDIVAMIGISDNTTNCSGGPCAVPAAALSPGTFGTPSTQVLSIQANDPCTYALKSSKAISVATATTTALVALSGSTVVYVCGYSMTISPSATAADTAVFEYGTGATCGTGTTALTGTYGNGDLTSAAPVTHIQYGNGGYTVATAPAGNAVCILTAGTAVSVQGIMTYVQQ